MSLIILKDATMLEFDNKKYFLVNYMGTTTTYILKPEFASPNRPTKIIIDSQDKTYYEEFVDGHPRTVKFAEVV